MRHAHSAVDDKFKDLANEVRGRCKSLRTLIYVGDGTTPTGMSNYEQLLAEASPADDVGSGGADLAAVMYIGGTTGFPRGVMLSHENLASNALGFVAERITHADATVLLIAPMFHVACCVMMNGHAIVGGAFVIEPAFTPLAP